MGQEEQDFSVRTFYTVLVLEPLTLLIYKEV